MQPQIRYTKTADGVNIAYYAIGSGQPTVFLPPGHVTHVELEWRVDDLRAGYERIARNSTWVRYDGRGFGLSDRDATDFSLDAMVRDLEAVVGSLDLPPAVLMSFGPASMTALAYAALHPERVIVMVLWEGVSKGDEGREMLRLARTNFALYKQLLAGQLGFASESSSAEMAHLMDEAATQENCVAYQGATAGWDVRNRLPFVKAPTLVLHRRGTQALVPAEQCRRLAAALPNGTFSTVEGSRISVGDPVSLNAIAPFLRQHLTRPTPTVSESPRAESATAVRTVLFTDIVGHTEMMQRLGDTRGREVLRYYERITRAALSAHGGTEVKTDGDSFMASFASVSAAVECAVALQRAFAEHNETKDEPILVRMGLNVGEPIEENGDFFGSAVILASRIRDQAGGNEILVPEAMRHMLSGKNFVFADRGAFALKGFEDSVRLYEVRWRE